MGKRLTSKAKTKAKEVKVKCKDCGATFVAGAMHYMFCPARTCSECGTTFSYALPVYDSRVTPVIRLCEDCTQEALDREE
jgi:DNA replicative helicase MCM subunit Mcm2 (Cdc46/Mcm family)